MDDIIAEIKGLQRSRKSLLESVERTCRTLKWKERRLRKDNGICSVDECYQDGEHLKKIPGDAGFLFAEEWLCGYHWKKEKGIIL